MCLFLKEKWEEKSHCVQMIEVQPAKEVSSFFRQGYQAITKKTPQIIEVDSCLEKYEFILFASPVWAFTIAPALRSYLRKISTLDNKKTACFLTFGSGMGSAKALGELENALREKHAHILFSQNLAGRKSKDRSFLENRFKPLFEIIG